MPGFVWGYQKADYILYDTAGTQDCTWYMINVMLLQPCHCCCTATIFKRVVIKNLKLIDNLLKLYCIHVDLCFAMLVGVDYPHFCQWWSSSVWTCIVSLQGPVSCQWLLPAIMSILFAMCKLHRDFPLIERCGGCEGLPALFLLGRLWTAQLTNVYCCMSKSPTK